jgi:hypothetical protein
MARGTYTHVIESINQSFHSITKYHCRLAFNCCRVLIRDNSPSAHKEADAAGKVTFSGLRVRMGIHVGPPICRYITSFLILSRFRPLVEYAC